MINQQRVRRIKNVIYALLLLLMIVPAIILIIVGVRMLSILQPINSIVDQIRASQSQNGAREQVSRVDEPDFYGLEPQDQEVDPESTESPAPAPAPAPASPAESGTASGSGLSSDFVQGNASPGDTPSAGQQPDPLQLGVPVPQKGGREPIPDTGIIWGKK